MTAPAVHARPLRGRSSWSRSAWMLLRIEMTKAREKANRGDAWSARSNILEARALCIKARTWDRVR